MAQWLNGSLARYLVKPCYLAHYNKVRSFVRSLCEWLAIDPSIDRSMDQFSLIQFSSLQFN